MNILNTKELSLQDLIEAGWNCTKEACDKLGEKPCEFDKMVEALVRYENYHTLHKNKQYPEWFINCLTILINYQNRVISRL